MRRPHDGAERAALESAARFFVGGKARARVKRPLTDEERARIASSAEHYVELAREYRATP